MPKHNYSVQELIQDINNAEQREKKLQLFMDTNIIRRYYDRNKAIRVWVASKNGKPIGDCVIENLHHYRELKEQGFNPKMYQAYLTNSIDENVFHAFLTITINGKKYMESKCNGLHQRIPYNEWASLHTFKNKRQVFDNPQSLFNFN